MNEVRISSVARYDTDFTPGDRWEPDSDTIGLYHFDEGQGTVLHDASGHGHHGEIVGAKWVKADRSPIGPPPAVTPPVAPLDAVQARAHQEASAKRLGIPVETTNSIGMKLRLIPPGRFAMGSSKEQIDFWLKQTDDGWVRSQLDGEGPQHEVEVTQPFYTGVTEVTVGQFRQFVMAQEYKTQAERLGGAYRHPPNVARKLDVGTNWLNPGFAQTDDHPVVCVSWNDAVEFCKWLGKQEGKNYRLPTEAEWECSGRAGSRSRWCFGDNEGELYNYARIGGNSQGHTWPVAGLSENAWGLHDMYGNVWEWCQDVYDANYYRTSPLKDPPGAGAGWTRVARGGSWGDAPVFCRSANRSQIHLLEPHNNLGFRVVLVVSPPAGVRPGSKAKDKPSSTAMAPLTDADAQRIAALPAEQQVEEVRKELMRRNPGFDGKMEHKIEGGVVTEFKIVTDKVTDISPIRVWSDLRMLDCGGTLTDKPNGLLADLKPLEGMNLAALTILHLSNTKVSDAGMVLFKDCKKLTTLGLFYSQVGDAGLIHFKDCKALTDLNLGWTKVTDAGLANFKDCKVLANLWLHNTQVGDGGMVHFQECKALTNLNLSGTKVSDAGLAHFKDCKNLKGLYLADTQVGNTGLAHLKGMLLRDLWIQNTGITDLTPLHGMPLEEIRLTPKNITRGLDILRDMKSLKTIGIDWNQSWPAAEFWERYDKGKFK
jgi:formylglycine-generating enzyme required for sulfatase activity